MVEVFKTNVHDEQNAAELAKTLSAIFPHGRINFDLDDCDRVLRIEHSSVCIESVQFILRSSGFDCEVMTEQ